MARTSKLTPEQIKRLVTDYQQSGLTRHQYCAQHGIATTTLDYYSQRLRNAPKQSQPLVQVKVQQYPPTQEQPTTFTLILSKGRRIETSNWHCDEQTLARLIRIVEAA